MRINPATQLIEMDNSDPTGIVSAVAGSTFYREGEIFYVSTPTATIPNRVEVSKKALAYRAASSQIWYAGSSEYRFTYTTTYESWYKQSGNGSSGWIFMGNQPIVSNYVLTFPKLELIYSDSRYALTPAPVPCGTAVNYPSGSASWQLNFQLNNSGSTAMAVGPVTVTTSAGATITLTQPSSSVAVGSFTTFSVNVAKAGSPPSSSATINIPNNGLGPNCQFSFVLNY